MVHTAVTASVAVKFDKQIFCLFLGLFLYFENNYFFIFFIFCLCVQDLFLANFFPFLLNCCLMLWYPMETGVLCAHILGQQPLRQVSLCVFGMNLKHIVSNEPPLTGKETNQADMEGKRP